MRDFTWSSFQSMNCNAEKLPQDQCNVWVCAWVNWCVHASVPVYTCACAQCALRHLKKLQADIKFSSIDHYLIFLRYIFYWTPSSKTQQQTSTVRDPLVSVFSALKWWACLSGLVLFWKLDYIFSCLYFNYFYSKPSILERINPFANYS